LKRAFDLFASLFGLLALSVALAPIALWIKLDSEGPVFYRGMRIGHQGKQFQIFKFRTMVVHADKIGGPSTSDDDPRVTRAGRLIRKLKIDEIPQLLNVLKGEMSLVGPRPEVPSEVEKYSQEERELLSVAPGITDWASIKFRNEGEILKGSSDPHRTYKEKIQPEKIRLGLEYAKRHSIWIDMRIISATIWAILGGNPEALVEMPGTPHEALGHSKRPDIS
jgi:lipopolysaccharide/colanic/teichoic acid biosynthesis glycosyltransferase